MGAEIVYKPYSDKDIARLHKFGSNMLPGIFLGYVQQSGGGWSGDLRVLDQEQIENALDISEIHERRLKAAEVEVLMDGENFRFPLADGSLKQPDVPVRIARPRRMNLQRIVDESAVDLFYDDDDDNNENPLPGHANDGDISAGRDAELESPSQSAGGENAEQDFWSMSGDLITRWHRTPRLKMYVPDENTFPIPLKYIDVVRTTITDLEIMMMDASMTFGQKKMVIVNCLPVGWVVRHSLCYDHSCQTEWNGYWDVLLVFKNQADQKTFSQRYGSRGVRNVASRK